MSLFESYMVIGLLAALLGACDSKSELAEVCTAFSSLELLLNYDAEARYRMFKRGADELVGRWDCPEMERLAPTLTE